MIVDCVGANGETEAAFKKFMSASGYNMPVFFDTEKIAQAAYGINSFPQTYFIDKDGKLANQFRGATSYSEIEKVIKTLI